MGDSDRFWDGLVGQPLPRKTLEEFVASVNAYGAAKGFITPKQAACLRKHKVPIKYPIRELPPKPTKKPYWDKELRDAYIAAPEVLPEPEYE